MRKALNDNPIAQIAVLGVLAVVVAFLIMTRVTSSSSSSTDPTTPTTSATPATATDTATPTTGATPAPTTGSTAVPTDGSAPTTTPTVPGSTSTGAAVPVSGRLVAGPGLPKPVAQAYADGKAIVVLVYRRNGIDDAAVRSSVERLRVSPDLAVFVTEADRVARYSRITAGLDVDRVPALIVIRPKSLSHGTPTASVSYGFRGAASVEQAVRDAFYKGPSNLPYYPK